MKNKRKGEFYFLCALVILASVFIFSKAQLAESKSTEILVINQIMTGDCTEAKNEFIELYNNSNDDIDLDGYKLTKKTKSGSESNLVSSSKFKGEVPKGGYFLISTAEYKDAIAADLAYSGSSYSIAADNTILLYDKSDNIIDKVGYGKAEDFEKNPVPNPPNGKSITRKDKRDTDNNSSDFILTDPESHNSEKKTTSSKIITSSCLPFSKDVGAKNISIKIDKEIYTNIYANFEVEYAGATAATKYTWDFGDEHKSYKQKTRHKFAREGTYQGSVTIRGDQSAVKNFAIEVRDYDAPKVKIVALVPNPKGKDSEEYISIKNNSKEKINLKNWSVATGAKKLYNHPIKKDFVIKKGETKKLTKKFSAFTLNNTKTKIELRDPTGEIVQKIKYDKNKDKIKDDETFELKGKNWKWKESVEDTGDSENVQNIKNARADKNVPAAENDQNIEAVLSEEELKKSLGKFTENSRWQNKKGGRVQLIGYGTKINTPPNLMENQGKVLGVSIEKNSPKEKHLAGKFSDILWKKINSAINRLLWR